MFCDNCGKPLPDGATFCHYCGTSTATAPPPTAPVPPTAVPVAPTAVPAAPPVPTTVTPVAPVIPTVPPQQPGFTPDSTVTAPPQPQGSRNGKLIIIILAAVLAVAIAVAAIIIVPRVLHRGGDNADRPWEYLDTGDGAIAVKKDGTVYCSDKVIYYDYEDQTNTTHFDTAGWTNIRSVAIDRVAVGLRYDGTVTVAGDVNDGGDRAETVNKIQSEVAAWTDIEHIYVWCFTVFGIRSDGTVVHTSNYYEDFSADLSVYQDVVQLSCETFWETPYLLLLFEDGTVTLLDGINSLDEEEMDEEYVNLFAVHNLDPHPSVFYDVSNWKDIVYIQATQDLGPLALTKDGQILHTDTYLSLISALDAYNDTHYTPYFQAFYDCIDGWENVKQFDISADDGYTFAAVLEDGSVNYVTAM